MKEKIVLQFPWKKLKLKLFYTICFHSEKFVFFMCSDILFVEGEAISKNVNDETKLEAYVELIAGLQCENKIQSILIENQSEMIKSLEEHGSGNGIRI